ncbi:PREDICTED: hydroxyacylglutathione hydrolase cytoplasmic-like [Prunus mume]|uniref:Hydroxyacylglutathione hydrolase cytoplasmic-like n=1 Tax=Prunus mume TaxID=102107 RepID=A0ABM0PXS6_PRUMU|nr:PREDICTED: hydroxyacylglutathione hydrolase cytoplasmic-like [Prunus mume]
MHQSLCVTLGSLPKPTRVYCGHEYTVKNLQFALTVEPDNEKIKQKLSWAQKQRETGLPTVPSTIEEEMEMNPFMRADLPELQVCVFSYKLITISWFSIEKKVVSEYLETDVAQFVTKFELK